MAAPFAACVVLVGIHAYLGMHVIQRRVIFVDLALAQIAALGATFGFLLGMTPHDREAYFFSLGFAVVGAAIFPVWAAVGAIAALVTDCSIEVERHD